MVQANRHGGIHGHLRAKPRRRLHRRQPRQPRPFIQQTYNPANDPLVVLYQTFLN